MHLAHGFTVGHFSVIQKILLFVTLFVTVLVLYFQRMVKHGALQHKRKPELVPVLQLINGFGDCSAGHAAAWYAAACHGSLF